MERLTEKYYRAGGYYAKCSGDCDRTDIDCIDCAALEMLVDRLGAYEDTGLTPERCAELAEADRDGRLRIQPKSEEATCGSCKHFKRIKGTRRGTCEIRRYIMDKWGHERPERGAFEPVQSRKSCKQYCDRGGGIDG